MPPKNKAEIEFIGKVAALGCIVCRNLGYSDSPAEYHHLRDALGMSQRDHSKGIPLCMAHHRGPYGTGIHASQLAFEERYGTEQELFKQVLELLEK